MAIVTQRALHLDIKMHLDKEVLSVCHVRVIHKIVFVPIIRLSL